VQNTDVASVVFVADVTDSGLCASIHIPFFSVVAFRKSKGWKTEERNEERKEEKTDLPNP
jgi:hypothetical protein